MIEKKVLSGGINRDDHIHMIPSGDCYNAENMRIVPSINGGGMVGKPLEGTRVVLENAFQVTASRKIIGSIEDRKYGRLIHFKYSAAGDHAIQMTDGKNIYNILKEWDLAPNAGLNFREDSKIFAAIIGDFLYWTDNHNPPRRINMERGIATYINGYTSPNGVIPKPYHYTMGEKDISVVRPQPKLPLSIVKVDRGRSNNLIANDSFQFAYRYVYLSGEVSTLSPYSKVARHNNPDKPDAFDTVSVSLPSNEAISTEVFSIEFMVRRGNTGSWFIVKTYDRDREEAIFTNHNSGTTLSFDFYNDTNGIPVPDSESSKPFDSVPLKSQAIEIATNRLFLGNNLEGYDPVNDVNLTASVVNQTTAGVPGEYFYVVSQCEDSSAPEREVIIVKVNGQGAVDGYYETTETVSDFNNETLPEEITLSSGQKIGDIADFPTDQDLIDYYGPPGCNTYYLGQVVSYNGTQPNVKGLTGSGTPASDEGTVLFKSDANYKLGIVFYDYAGRNAGVFTKDSLSIITPDRTYAQNSWNVGISWNLPGGFQSAIPEWATHYSIVRTKNLKMSSFMQHFVSDVKYAERSAAGGWTIGGATSGSDSLALAFNLHYFTRDGLGYTFTEGDVVKARDSNDNVHVLRVLGVDGKYVITEYKDIGSTVAVTLLVEIYTPNFGAADEFFYEVGETYEILYPGTSDREFSATMGILKGDVVLKSRSYGSVSSTENMNPNDRYWSDWITDIGRPSVEIRGKGQRLRHTSFRHSNTYVNGTKTNGLSSFDVLNFENLPAEVGPIQRFVWTSQTADYGNVLLAICTNQTASIYIGRTQIFDDNGSATLAKSSGVVGSVNILKGGYGTKHPESVVETKGTVYWLDVASEAICRYSTNGIFPVSNYKVKSFWREICKRISASRNRVFMYGGYDEFHDEYMIHIPFSTLYQNFELNYLEDLYGEILKEEDNIKNNAHTTEFTFETRKYKVNIDVVSALWKNMRVVYDGRDILPLTPIKNSDSFEIIVDGRKGADDIQFYFDTPQINKEGGVSVKIRENVRSYYDAKDIINKVFVFNAALERWTDFRTFSPDWMGSLNEDFVSYYLGSPYFHDQTNLPNYFYGTIGKSRVVLIGNQGPHIVKVFESISVEADTAPNYIHVRTENPNTQSSDIEAGEFTTLEGVHYAEVKRDRLSPNVTGYDKALMAGDPIRSEAALFTIEMPPQDFKLRFVNIQSLPSKGHKTK